MDKNKRINDIIELTRNLDITPTMMKNATEKYQNIGKYFQSIGFECDIFPLGSFATGTVVRPFFGEKEQNYDLDFICLLNKRKEQITPKETKLSVRDGLSKSDVYSKILSKNEWDKCWTLEYADVNGVGFNMDIVPAAKNDSEVYLISITNKKGTEYDWINSRPKAYVEWFAAINEPFRVFERDERRELLYKQFEAFYNSVEEIPESMERSVLQRVIQMIKRHRDMYFSKAGEKYKTASIIITTLVAQIAESIDSDLDFYELLNIVVQELSLYEKYLTMKESRFMELYQTKNIICKKDGVWIIPNPVNKKENLADSWKGNPKKAELFFKWIKQLREDFIEDIEKSDEQFLATLGNAFGHEYFEKSKVRKKYNVKKPKVLNSVPKPYGCDEVE